MQVPLTLHVEIRSAVPDAAQESERRELKRLKTEPQADIRAEIIGDVLIADSSPEPFHAEAAASQCMDVGPPAGGEQLSEITVAGMTQKYQELIGHAGGLPSSSSVGLRPPSMEDSLDATSDTLPDTLPPPRFKFQGAQPPIDVPPESQQH